jgi:hypothetical protein
MKWTELAILRYSTLRNSTVPTWYSAKNHLQIYNPIRKGSKGKITLVP